MAETSTPDSNPRKALWSRPIGRVAFWVCGAIAVVAFGAAVVAAGEDGWQGFVYLSGLAAVGFLVLYAIAAGETAGRNLRRKIEKNRAPSPAALAFRAIETFPEPVLITDRAAARAGAMPPTRRWPAGPAGSARVSAFRRSTVCGAASAGARGRSTAWHAPPHAARARVNFFRPSIWARAIFATSTSKPCPRPTA